MRCTVFIIFSLFIALSSTANVTKFTTKYDNVNVDEILKNSRLFDNYYNCIIGKGKCTPDGQELKNAIPLALRDQCAGCSERQKYFAEIVIKHISTSMPSKWTVLQDKFDPDRRYTNRNAQLAMKLKIKV